jgi:hypothetical protein
MSHHPEAAPEKFWIEEWEHALKVIGEEYVMAALSVAIQHWSMARDRAPKPWPLPSNVVTDDHSRNHKILID